MESIKFIQTHPDAILPKKNHTNDACWDIFAVKNTVIPANKWKIVPVGLKMGYIPKGYFIKFEARSGNGFKKHLYPHFGIIDNGYKGDLGVLLFSNSDKDQVIKKHHGVAQFRLIKSIDCDVEFISQEDVEKTDRGEKGFGSSDKKKYEENIELNHYETIVKRKD